MNGMNAASGRPLGGIEHLRQSVRDILCTPIGSRVMRREYGSRLHALVDAPLNRTTLLQMYAATAEALHCWEPRLKVLSMSARVVATGSVSLDITGEYLPDGERVTLEGIVVT